MCEKTTLDSGLRVITCHMPYVRSVSICIFIGVGSRYEDDASAGISHFIEHLLFKGTVKRAQARDIAEAIEGVGGIINAGTDKELTVYWCKVARTHFLLALDVLLDMMLNSKLEPEEIERERQVIIEEIHMIKDSPQQHVSMLIDELLWPDHPLGRDIAGSAESISVLSRDTIVDFLAGRYHPGNTVVAIAGDITHEEALQAVDGAVLEWAGEGLSSDFLAFNDHANPRLRVVQRDTEQTHLCLALPGLPLLHPKRYTLDLLNVILGDGMSSRLFSEIRDNLGLAYNIHSYAEHLHDTGALTIYAGVEHKNLPVAVSAVLEQLTLLKEPVIDSELLKAKQQSRGRLLLRMEDSRSVASWTGGQEILTGNILSIDDVMAKIDAVTAGEISQLAGELLSEGRLRMAVVGPGDGSHLVDLLKL